MGERDSHGLFDDDRGARATCWGGLTFNGMSPICRVLSEHSAVIVSSSVGGSAIRGGSACRRAKGTEARCSPSATMRQLEVFR